MSEWQPIETAPRDGTEVILMAGVDAFRAKWTDGFVSDQDEALQRAAASPMGEALAGMDHLFAYEVATGTGGSDAGD